MRSENVAGTRYLKGFAVGPSNEVEVEIHAGRANHGLDTTLAWAFPYEEVFCQPEVEGRRRPRRRRRVGRDLQCATGQGGSDFPVGEDHANASTSLSSWSGLTHRRLAPVSASWGSSIRTSFVRGST